MVLLKVFNSISLQNIQISFFMFEYLQSKNWSPKRFCLKWFLKENAEHINTNFAFVFPLIPKHIHNVCSIRARFQKFDQISRDTLGVCELVKNTIGTFCISQCLITLKNLVNYLLTVFNGDALPVFVLLLPMLHEQKKKKIFLMQQHILQ